MEILCEDFKVGKCEWQKSIEGEQVPLVLNPSEPHLGDLRSLLAALSTNKDRFEEALLRNSAILLRGYDLRDAEGFNDLIEALGWDDIQYEGHAIRNHVHKRVWTANEGPLSAFIFYHHEMVLIKEYPAKVILFCEVPPPEGGETPIVPSFRVTERMAREFPEIVSEMEEKGLRYTFDAPSKNDISSTRGRGWEDAFGTSDRVEAEERARAMGIDLEWLPNGGVKTIFGPCMPLTRVFPKREGRRMWFNTVVSMHGREHSSATMANGSEIHGDVVKRCKEIIEEESIQFKWEKGDVLFLDNLALLHGRRPSLPPRRVLVATCK